MPSEKWYILHSHFFSETLLSGLEHMYLERFETNSFIFGQTLKQLLYSKQKSKQKDNRKFYHVLMLMTN